MHVAMLEGEVQYEPRGQALSSTVPTGHQLPDPHAVWVEGVVHTEPRAHRVWDIEPWGQ